MARIWKKWTPAVGAVAAVATAAFAGPALGPVIANAAVDLPDKTPAQVLELAGGHDVDALSGTIEQTSDMGLPDLSLTGPNGGQGPTSDSGSPDGSSEMSPESAALEMLTESHTVRVFLDGPEHARIQVQDRFAERNLIRNGNDVWYYDSEENTATHAVIPSSHKHADMQDDRGSLEGQQAPDEQSHPIPGDAPTPGQLAEKFLGKVDSSTEVTVGADKIVAGRAAYDLLLTPRTSETLVGSISIAVDGETGLPLAVSVTARGETSPAFSVAFSDISLEAPDAELFEFTPPANATVKEVQDKHHSADKHEMLNDRGERHDGSGQTAKPEMGSQDWDDQAKPTVIGSDWSAVLELPGRGDLESMDREMIDQLSTPVDGGRLLQTKLVNVLLTDDGRVLVGAVPAERLQSVAAGQ
ncbi:LolA family protein [Arthrobacter monumenti]